MEKNNINESQIRFLRKIVLVNPPKQPRQVSLFAATLTALLLALFPVNSQAQVTVGFNNFTTIQAALNFVEANPPGDGQPVTVSVEPGLYCEMLVMPTTVSIRLENTDPFNPPTIKGPGVDVGDTVSCSQNDGGSTVRHFFIGFRITNGRNGIGVRTGCDITTIGCVIELNEVGVNVVGGGSTLNNSTIQDNNTGIKVTNDDQSEGSALLVESSVISNGGKGFIVEDSGGGGVARMVFDDTDISENVGAGEIVGANVEVEFDGQDNTVTDNLESVPGANDGGITIDTGISDGSPITNFFSVNFSRNEGPDLNFFPFNVGNLTVPEGAPQPNRRTNSSRISRFGQRRSGGMKEARGVEPGIPVIMDCTFENGVSDMFFGDASAILTDGVDLMIVDCDFIGNESNNEGAAVVCKGSANATITGCNFENNNSFGSFDEGAGAIVCDGTSPVIINCAFVGNTARIEAGAIRNLNGAAPLIQNCQFIGNQADRIAGAIINQSNSNPMIVDCSFEMNLTINASSEGGAIVNQGSSPTIYNCTFTGNQSDDGGAICNEDSGGVVSNPLITDCQFVGNIATGAGGAVDCTGSNLVLEDCVFDNNQSSSSGGAISFNDSSQNDPVLTLTNCSFVNHNVAFDGAAIVGSDGEATLDGCSFINNSAGRNGGALRILSSNLAFKFCNFENNSAAEDGGAIACFNGTTGTHIGCSFVGNQAGEFGGAVYYSESAVASYLSCAFSGNSSNQNGGAITTLDLPGDTISNCTFTNNSAVNLGGAIFANNNTVVEISNSIIWENGTSAIQVESGSSANVSFSNVQGGFAGTGNMNTDPLFENAVGGDGVAGTLDDDLRVQASSPMIDAGNNDVVPADDLDIDGDGDLVEPLPLDLRMMFRFADNPDVPDAGNGIGPIVDIGAIEFSAILLGDVNLDGLVNLLDIGPFIERLSDGTFQAEADTNQDGIVNLLDVGPFVEILSQ